MNSNDALSLFCTTQPEKQLYHVFSDWGERYFIVASSGLSWLCLRHDMSFVIRMAVFGRGRLWGRPSACLTKSRLFFAVFHNIETASLSTTGQQKHHTSQTGNSSAQADSGCFCFCFFKDFFGAFYFFGQDSWRVDRKQGRERGNDTQQRTTGGTEPGSAAARTQPLYMGKLYQRSHRVPSLQAGTVMLLQ